MRHQFVERRSPVKTVDYAVFDEILARNAKIASKEKQDSKKFPRKNSG